MPRAMQFEGSFEPFDDDSREGLIERATLIVREDGGQGLTLRGREDDGVVWEAHLHSSDGRSFAGVMSSREWDYEYAVQMELWISPGDGEEVLLLGTWRAVGEQAVRWCVTLWPPESD